MANCLETQLKERVNNRNLDYLGYTSIHVKSNCTINVSVDYSTLISGNVLKNGEVIDTISNYNELRGSYTCVKGDVIQIPEKNLISAYNLSSSAKYQATVKLSYMGNLTSLVIMDNTILESCSLDNIVKNTVTSAVFRSNYGSMQTTLPISFLKGFKHITRLEASGMNVTGNISELVSEDFISITNLNLSGNISLSGDLDTFAQALWSAGKRTNMTISISGSENITVPSGISISSSITISFNSEGYSITQ